MVASRRVNARAGWPGKLSIAKTPNAPCDVSVKLKFIGHRGSLKTRRHARKPYVCARSAFKQKLIICALLGSGRSAHSTIRRGWQ